MPQKIDEEDRARMMMMRAKDYDKDEIADELGVSHTTVTRHLEEMREEIEESNQSEEDELIRNIARVGAGAAAAGLGAAAVKAVLDDQDIDVFEVLEEGAQSILEEEE